MPVSLSSSLFLSCSHPIPHVCSRGPDSQPTAVTTQQFVQKHSQQHLTTPSDSDQVTSHLIRVTVAHIRSGPVKLDCYQLPTRRNIAHICVQLSTYETMSAYIRT